MARVTTIALGASVAEVAPYLREHLPGAKVRKHKDSSQRVIYIQHPTLDQFSFSVLSGMAEFHKIPLLDVGENEEFDDA